MKLIMKLVLFGFGAVTLLCGQVSGGNFSIALKSRTFDPTEDVFLVTEILDAAGNPTTGLIHFFLQFKSVPTVAQRETIEGDGFNFVDYISAPGSVGVHIMSTDVNKTDLYSVEHLPNARWAGPIKATDKIDPRLLDDEDDKPVELDVQFYCCTDKKTKDIIEGCGGYDIKDDLEDSFVTATFNETFSETCLAQEDAVKYISKVLPPPNVTNDEARVVANVAPLATAPYNLNGAGVTILVEDGGVVDTHLDFNARVIEREPRPANPGFVQYVSNHATHVCGICCGDGANSNGADTAGVQNSGTSNQWQGMAPGVLIRSFTPYFGGDGTRDFRTAMASVVGPTIGIDLATRSLGNSDPQNLGLYSTTDQQFDGLVRGDFNNQQLIFFNSAGNARDDPLPPGVGPYTTLGSGGAPSKNAITVGAIHKEDNSMTDFSGWGPTADGRLKPDIVAPGCSIGRNTPDNEIGITSTTFADSIGPDGVRPIDPTIGYLNPGEAQNTYRSGCGTSQATPVASGTAALLIQQWRLLNGVGTRPLPHTVKAILIHTATDLGRPGPDYEFGWGALNAKKAIDVVRLNGAAPVIHVRTILQGGEIRIQFNSDGSRPNIRVTLVWDDPAPNPMGRDAFVDDLDLSLLPPNGVPVRPWVLDPNNAAAPAVRKRDDRNNVEMVVAPDQAGTWTAIITGTKVSGGPGTQQQFTVITAQIFEPPVVACAAACTGLTCTFTQQSSDEDGTVVGWAWVFGDGTTFNGPNPPPKTYATSGAYTVTLQVTDDDGLTADTTCSVTVTPCLDGKIEMHFAGVFWCTTKCQKEGMQYLGWKRGKCPNKKE